MPAAAFHLRLSVEPQFRALATDVITRYFDIIGVSEPDRARLASAFSTALEGLVPSAEGGTPATVEVSCVGGPGGGELRLRCGSKSAVVPYSAPSAVR